MRRNHISLIVLMLLLGGFTTVQTSAVDGPGNGGSQGPLLECRVDFPTELFRVEASDAQPGQVGMFQFVVTTIEDTPTQSIFDVLFQFDPQGHVSADLPLLTFSTGGDFYVAVRMLTLGTAPNTINSSEVWWLMVKNYAVSPSQSPPPGLPGQPGGWTTMLPIPGTSAPLFPWTEVALDIGEGGLGGGGAQQLLYVGCAPGGPSGSFPIN